MDISEDVLASIAGGAAAEVEGISGMMSLAAKKSSAKGVRVSLEDDSAVIDLCDRLAYLLYHCPVENTTGIFV